MQEIQQTNVHVLPANSLTSSACSETAPTFEHCTITSRNNMEMFNSEQTCLLLKHTYVQFKTDMFKAYFLNPYFYIQCQYFRMFNGILLLHTHARARARTHTHTHTQRRERGLGEGGRKRYINGRKKHNFYLIYKHEHYACQILRNSPACTFRQPTPSLVACYLMPSERSHWGVHSASLIH